MFDRIVANIICSEYERTFGRVSTFPDADNAMQVRFSLDADCEVEEGYRHLTILLHGGGGRYIGVYAKLDWNVIAKADLTNELYMGVKPGRDYVEGETPWVVRGYHDSCWRDAVCNILWEYRDRVTSIDYPFNGATGWFKSIPVDEEMKKSLYEIRNHRYNLMEPTVNLKDLEFQFPEPNAEGSDPVYEFNHQDNASND